MGLHSPENGIRMEKFPFANGVYWLFKLEFNIILSVQFNYNSIHLFSETHIIGTRSRCTSERLKNNQALKKKILHINYYQLCQFVAIYMYSILIYFRIAHNGFI